MSGLEPAITDAELITLAVMSALLRYTSERRWLRTRTRTCERCSLRCPASPVTTSDSANWPTHRVADQRPGRDTGVGDEICGWSTRHPWSVLARPRRSNARIWPGGPSTATAPRTIAASGVCGCICCARARTAAGVGVTENEADERDVLIEIVATTPTLVSNTRASATIIGDKNYYGNAFEATLAENGITLLRPARKGEDPRPGHRFFKPLRQIIESMNDTLKGQLDLEHHHGRTIAGVCTRIGQRILALTAAIWHDDRIGHTIRRSLTPYDH